MTIDTHVHLRDFNQRKKETISHGLEVAKDSGVDAVFDMPNTDPAIMTAKEVEERLKLAKEAQVKDVFYGLYMGLTSDTEQIKRAVETLRRNQPQLVGFKLYAGHSTGNLGVIGIENQRRVYQTLVAEGYEGVLFVHAEKEEVMEDRKNLWTPNDPISHCVVRIPSAEIESVEDQIFLAKETGFKGKLHIAHVSVPRAVEIINEAKSYLDISCGICPHHLIFDWSKMRGENGILFKMNPPLRAPGQQNRLLEMLKDGKIDWIETDHAPHTLEEKTSGNFLSGVPGLTTYTFMRNYLRINNFPEERIEEVIHFAPMKRFGIDIANKNKPLRDRSGEYAFDAYEETKKQISIN